ncbi:MAG: pseudouridine synthase [Thermoanaerobaculales bacterium]|nr:pseudouridine synthase [Thermoanaerobaculales bacterium]
MEPPPVPAAAPDPAQRAADRANRGSDVRPSTVTLPAAQPAGVGTVLDFFLLRFPHLPAGTWQARFAAGSVWTVQGPLRGTEPFRSLLRVHYRREVEHEPPVRTDFRVVWRDDELIVVDKPPHLPVTPGGPWVRNCLLHLLARATGSRELAPLHRLDRLTSGLVLFSCDRRSRGRWAQALQEEGGAEKVYTAVCEPRCGELPQSATLEHHIARSPDAFWRQVVVGDRAPNSRSEIELLETGAGLAAYRVRPVTGRKHQIRVQLAAVGLPILGDPIYGTRPFHDPADLATRMWLDAHVLAVTGVPSSGGNERLTANWSSSRTPAAMLHRAARCVNGIL